MDYLRQLNIVTILIRVLLALIIGGIIGLERESKKQPAGFRTYTLVCLGAALVMMTNQYINDFFQNGDPSRLGAQVISGIGFLGAGTIIVTQKSQVRGLTTAAGLWSAACIGLAIGIGFYEGSIIAGVALLLIMTVFHKVDSMLLIKSKMLHIYVNFVSVEAMNFFISYCKERGIRVHDIQISKVKNREDNQTEIMTVFVLKGEKRKLHVELIQEFGELEGVRYIEEI